VIKLGTRGSRLARAQTGLMADALAASGLEVEIVVIRSEGDDTRVALDSFARPGAFVAALQDALLAGSVDAVVHSYKDLPSAPTPGLTVAAVPARAGVRDLLITRDGRPLDALPAGASVGTSSPRRTAALLRARPDLVVMPIRGNVDTRLRAVTEARLDAIVLAEAGLARLGLPTEGAVPLDAGIMLPAPAQGALAVECRAGDPLSEALAVLDDPPTRVCVTAERAVLAGVEAACTTAVGASARLEFGALVLDADLAGHHGVDYARCTDSIELDAVAHAGLVPLPDADLARAEELGRRVAARLLETAP